MKDTSTRSALLLGAAAVLSLATSTAHAEVTPQRTWTTLVSSNGHGAVVVDLEPGSGAQIHHFREHIFATEEPQIDASGNDVFVNGSPQSVYARDLLNDTFFGLRANGTQRWLKSLPVDLDASGFEGTTAGATGGTGIVRMVQRWNDLEITQYIFAPFGLEHAGFAMIARVKNTGSSTATGVSVFTLNNFHLGFGRPGANQEIGSEFETIVYDASHDSFQERAFAGVVVTRALGGSTHHGSDSDQGEVFPIVDNGGTTDLPDLNGEAATANDSVSAFQRDIGSLAAGEETWFGVVNAHHGDPFGAATVEGWLDAWVAGRTPQQIVQGERALWATFQSGLTLPSGLTPEQEALYRQSAVVLRMAQVREDEMYLRPSLTNDLPNGGDTRRTRFGTTLGGPPAELPATVKHRGKGAVLASLPPGEWTYAWPRDGAYAIIGMSLAGMQTEAHDALKFYLEAEGGRFQNYNELASYDMPAYLISLTRYHGFGVEETDYNSFGPNLEFDGFGLFLWALRAYTDATGDTSLRSSYFDAYTTKVADAIVGLIDPSTGLMRKDSSIWESHWNGRERTWTYTNITAARGLCDAAAMAQAEGDGARATAYATAAESLREAIAQHLTDANGGLASNAEELAAGQGYWDAAVLDAIAMGLFDPNGTIATATLAGIDNLRTTAGVGWARNDDGTDHAGGTDLSPWGGEYDNAEWVITDMRGAVAHRLAGNDSRSDDLIGWVRRQSAENYLEVAETYDENTGHYKFNAPMVGFGAGAWIMAINHAKGAYSVDPACGAYYDETGGSGGGGGAGGTAGAAGSGGTAGAGGTSGSAGAAGSAGVGGDAGSAGSNPGGAGGSSGSGAAAGSGGSGGTTGSPVYTPDDDEGGCGCSVPGSNVPAGTGLGALLGLAMALLRRRR